MPSAARGIAVASLLLVHAAWAAGPGEGPAVAQPPAAVVDTAAVEPSGRAIAVPSGGDLQAALDSARPGDVVTLEPGAVYRGPFTLPKKSGSGWIVVRTGGDARAATALPRIDPGQAPKLAKLVAASGSVVKTAPGAHHYRLSGLEIRPTEGAGVNVMFGGVDPSIRDLVPSDIEILRNHVAKPLAWKADAPSYAGTPWTVKNLFELKNARRVRVEGNLFEHSWVQAQIGFAIVLTVRNQDGRAPWSVVEDVTFANNVTRGATSGVNIHGRDNNHPSQPTRRIAIRNNLFADIGGPHWGGEGRLFQIVDGTSSVVIEHNTALHIGTIITAEAAPHRGFVFTDNIVAHNTYGITGTGVGIGTQALDALFPGAVVRRNVIVGGSSAQYPRDNFFVRSWAQVKFEDLAQGRVRLTDASPFRRAGLDGTDVGVDASALTQTIRPGGDGRR